MKTRNRKSPEARIQTPKTKPFKEIVRISASRRAVLQGGLASAAVAFFGIRNQVQGQENVILPLRPGLTDFTALPRDSATGPWPTISEDYEFSILLPWGDPLEPEGPAFAHPPTGADQELQIGIGHDGLWFFPDPDFPEKESSYGLLVINHEFGSNSVVLGKSDPESLDDVRVSQHAHGVSIVGIEKVDGVWTTYATPNARRIHANTPVSFSGPAASHADLQTDNGNTALGTINNCGCGHTPWGTYLTCEENFNLYFGATNETTTWEASESQQRYGFSTNGAGYGWHDYDKRFDLSDSDYENEENRFGWVVEIDPFDPNHVPVKRTALGRLKHESVAVTVGDRRRVVCYMGDDQGDEYLYKFVSADDHVGLVHAGISPFDFGTLYVARFDADNTGRWMELSLLHSQLALRFATMGDLLINTRSAADVVGATEMDRPEWITVAEDDWVYVALTNNSGRDIANAANPQAPNPDGHIIRLRDDHAHTGIEFEWEIFQLASSTHGTEESYGSPDSIWVDPDGRLFIATDGSQEGSMNNQLLVADTVTKDVKRLFAGVTGCEVTGITTTPDRRTMFVNIQHPGNGDIEATDFPRIGDSPVPRDATISIRRKNGGIVGS